MDQPPETPPNEGGVEESSAPPLAVPEVIQHSPHWFQKVPVWISVLIGCGGWLLSAFAGALSQRFQIAGFILGVVILLACGAAFCAHRAWLYRNTERKTTWLWSTTLVVIAALGWVSIRFMTDPRVKFFGGDTEVISQEPMPIARASDLSLVAFRRGNYEAGKPVNVNVYFRYDGNESAKVQGKWYVTVMMMKGNLTPDDIALAEDNDWNTFEQLVADQPVVEMTIPPKSTPELSAWSGPLSEGQVKDLSTPGSGAALIYMGYVKWKSGGKTFETDYCGYTQHDPTINILCRNHNGPST